MKTENCYVTRQQAYVALAGHVEGSKVSEKTKTLIDCYIAESNHSFIVIEDRVAMLKMFLVILGFTQLATLYLLWELYMKVS